MHFLSLRHKIIGFSAIAALLLTVLISAIEIHTTIASNRQSVSKELRNFDKGFRDFLTNKVWAMEYDSLVEFSASVAHNLWLDRITINDARGNPIARAGEGVSKGSVTRRFELTYTHNDQGIPIGSVLLEGRILTIGEVLRDRLSTILLINGSLTLFIFVCAYLFVNRTVLTRLQHLITLFPATATNGEEQGTSGQDEIDLVTQQLKLRARQLGEELQRRRAAEAELERQNFHLKEEIAERLQIERELRTSREWHASILKTAMDGFLLVDLQGRILEVNRTYCQMSGYCQDELLAMFVHQLERVPHHRVDEHIEKIRSQGELRYETRHLCKDGSELAVEISAQFRDVDGGRLLCFLRDVSERRLWEERLRQAQKMEAIGTLAGGIAHDFNNILGAIIGYSEMIKDDLPLDSESTFHVEQVLRAGLRARDLVTQILAFSRQTNVEVAPLQPEVILKECIKLLRASLPSTIAIELDIQADCGIILANATQFHQIVMNLCTNSLHAMEEKGGVLDIKLRRIQLKEPHLETIVPLLPGEYLEMIVSDSGVGIPESIRSKIFEPYFTTKEVGKGTGLGLAVVHGIIAEYGGSISCTSSPGCGTTFRILLPLTDREMADENGAGLQLLQGYESILVVDDEAPLAEMVGRMLRKRGYQVTIAGDSQTALDLFTQSPQGYSLVITDQTMPQMTGMELARRLFELRPDVPVILCTGYSSQVSEQQARQAGIKGFAMKPINAHDLARLVRVALDGEATGDQNSRRSPRAQPFGPSHLN